MFSLQQIWAHTGTEIGRSVEAGTEMVLESAELRPPRRRSGRAPALKYGRARPIVEKLVHVEKSHLMKSKNLGCHKLFRPVVFGALLLSVTIR